MGTGSDIELGRIKLGKQIGQGGYGIVYEAILPELANHEVAVKVLDPSPFQGSKAKDRFIQEAKILLSLRHPHIISINGCGVHDGKPYILMERFAGRDLQHVRDTHGAPHPQKVLPFFRKIASALAYAHSQDILHRDLKPSNLMTTQGDARVIDFGIARIIDPNGDRFTRSGGTPVGGAFCAPELVDNPRLEDPRSDIFSLGACWYWLLTGFAPSGRNWEAALTNLDGVDSNYASIVFKMLESLHSRFVSMADVEREIMSLESGHQTKSSIDLLMDDNTMLILGSIFELEAPGVEGGVSAFDLERQMSNHLSKLTMRLTLKRLNSHGLVRIGEMTDWNNTYDAYFVTDEGKDWVEQHQERIESLLQNIAPKSVAASAAEDPDVPF